MKFLKKFSIIGLLIVVLINQLTANKLSTHLKTLNADLKSKGKDLQKNVESNIVPLAEHPENYENFVRVAAGVASIMLPQPLGLAIGITSSVLFAFYDAHQAKKEAEIAKQGETKKLIQEELFKKQLMNDIHEVGMSVAAESHRIIHTVTKAIDKLADHVSSNADRVIVVITRMFNTHILLYDLRKTLDSLNHHYNDNIDCLLKSKCSPEERNNIIEESIFPRSDFRKQLATFVTAFIDTEKTLPTSADQEYGFFSYLLEAYKQRTNDGRDCNIETEQSEIYRLYVTIMLTLEKSYSMVTAAHMIRYRENAGNQTLAMLYLSSAIRIFEKSNADAVAVTRIAQESIKHVSTEIRRCDPMKHQRGITYDRFVQLFGIYTGFTYDRFVHSNGSYDFIDTTLYPVSRYHMNDSFPDGLYGISNESMIRLGDECHIDRTVAEVIHYYDNTDTERFYHHIDIIYSNGTNETFGRLNDNNKPLVSRYYENPFRVSGKFCRKYCPTPVETCPAYFENSVRLVSLAPVEASPRHVITGIRWRIREKILHMEIQQARYANGSVKANTIHWKDRPMHEIADRVVQIDDGFAKGFVLDDVQLPAGYLLSGVQFLWNSNLTQGGGLIELKITGKQWEGDLSYSVSKNSTKFSENKMQRLAIDNADASEYAPSNALLSRPGENFVHFQMSDMKKDAAQSSIPYLDIQEVVSAPPRALQGIGLYYKGRAGFGGFIGLRAFIADISPQVDPIMMERYGTVVKIMMEELNNSTTPVA